MDPPVNTPYELPPAGWTIDSPNPFSADGAYGPQWSALELMDANDAQFFHGTRDNGLFTFRAGRRCVRLEERLADFLRYEHYWGRRVIATGPADVDIDALLRRVLDEIPSGPVVRALDPRWMSHSTTLPRWQAIRACGELRSLARLRREGLDIRGVGLADLREPDDYAEHVMLGIHDAINGEFVVASHGTGTIRTEENTPYEPGVRLYFDCHRIIRDGLAVRDGLHQIKIHDHLRLDPYLVATIGVADVDPTRLVPTWTPASFLAAASLHFTKTVEDGIGCD